MYSLFLLAVSISALLSLSKADEPLIVNTTLGPVEGVVDVGGARLWKGKFNYNIVKVENFYFFYFF